MEDKNNVTPTPEELTKARKMAFDALKSKPTEYEIDVKDNSMLPDNLKGKDVLFFVIKPPTLSTLQQLAEIVNTLPEDVFKPDTMTAEVMKHIPTINEMIAILVHGSSKKKMPEWYVPFFGKNITTEETLLIWQETTIKLQSGFFLPFFQTARLLNPMTMMTESMREQAIKDLESSTLSNSSMGQ